MSEIPRFNIAYRESGGRVHASLRNHVQGDLVLYEDHKEKVAALEAECAVYRAALKLIAGSDYRGNRPREHRIAQEPLDAYPDN
jgi:hypothetical protein